MSRIYNPTEDRNQNKLVFIAIIPAAAIFFVILYLIKVNHFNFLDHPVLTKILQFFGSLIPDSLRVPGGRQ